MLYKTRPITKITAIIACLLGNACSSNDLLGDYQKLSVEQIYEAAFIQIEGKRWLSAAQAFNEVERQHPYSVWAQKSLLMAAYALYRAGQHEDSLASAQQYTSLFPGSRNTPYAYYLIAINHFDQMLDVERDQKYALNAQKAFQELIARYPASEYAYDASIKLELVRDQLAGQIMHVGLYHLKAGQLFAAMTRYRMIIDSYQTTAHTPEALYRMVEIWLTLGIDTEALKAASILSHNHPDSTWYTRAYTLIHRYHNIPEKIKS